MEIIKRKYQPDFKNEIEIVDGGKNEAFIILLKEDEDIEISFEWDYGYGGRGSASIDIPLELLNKLTKELKIL